MKSPSPSTGPSGVWGEGNGTSDMAVADALADSCRPARSQGVAEDEPGERPGITSGDCVGFMSPVAGKGGDRLGTTKSEDREVPVSVTSGVEMNGKVDYCMSSGWMSIGGMSFGRSDGESGMGCCSIFKSTSNMTVESAELPACLRVRRTLVRRLKIRRTYKVCRLNGAQVYVTYGVLLTRVLILAHADAEDQVGHAGTPVFVRLTAAMNRFLCYLKPEAACFVDRSRNG
jgi:hypothetical protein